MKRQIASIISEETWLRFSDLRNTTGLTARQVLEQALLAYQPGIATVPVNGLEQRVAGLEAQVAALQARLDGFAATAASAAKSISAGGVVKAVVAEPAAEPVVETEPSVEPAGAPTRPIEEACDEYAGQGLGYAQIARKLTEDGFRTRTGKPISKGDRRIKKAKDRLRQP